MLWKRNYVFLATLSVLIFHISYTTSLEEKATEPITETGGYIKEFDDKQKSGVIVNVEVAPAAITVPTDVEENANGYFNDDRLRNAPPAFHSFLNYDNNPQKRELTTQVTTSTHEPTSTLTPTTTTTEPVTQKTDPPTLTTGRPKRSGGQETTQAIYHPNATKPTSGHSKDIKNKTFDDVDTERKSRDDKLEFIKLIDKVGFDEALRVFQEFRNKSNFSITEGELYKLNNKNNINGTMQLSSSESEVGSTQPQASNSSFNPVMPQMGRTLGDDVIVPPGIPDSAEMTNDTSKEDDDLSINDLSPFETHQEITTQPVGLGNDTVNGTGNPSIPNQLITTTAASTINDRLPNPGNESLIVPLSTSPPGVAPPGIVNGTASPVIVPGAVPPVTVPGVAPPGIVPGIFPPGTIPLTTSTPTHKPKEVLHPASYVNDANDLLNQPNGSYVNETRIFYLNPTANNSNATAQLGQDSNAKLNAAADLSSKNESSELSCPNMLEFLEGSHDFWVSLMEASGVKSGVDILVQALIHSMKVLGNCFYKVSTELLEFVTSMFSTPGVDMST